MRVFKYLGEHKLAVFVVLALLLVQAFCELSLPALTADLVDVGIMEGYNSPEGIDMGYLLSVGAQMIGVTAAAALLATVISYVASTASAKIGRDLRERLFHRVISFSEAEVQSFSAASLITRSTNDVQQVQLTCSMLLRMVLYAPILAIGGIVMVIRTDTRMGWVIVAAIVAVFLVMIVLFVAVLPKFRMMQTLIDKVNLVSREILTGMPVIRAFNRQSYEQERFDAASTDLMKTQLFTGRAMSLMQPAIMLIMNGVSVLIVWVAGGFINDGTMQTGDMIAFITYATVIIMSFIMLSSVAILLPRADVAAGRIEEVLTCQPSITDAPVVRDSELAETPGAEIAFHNVTFCFGDAQRPAIEEVSFTAHAGQTVALIGPTGSGKTTLLKLLLRFYDATSGSITIDGIDIRSLSQTALRNQLGYVPQASFLFSGTIEDNIAYSDASMDAEKVQAAANIAQASGFINDKEEGYSSAISQGGTNVSGGQRQRLAIARAVASDARCFLFDDSFSALDYATDAALRQALTEKLGGATKIIVAQRVATIRYADLIVVLDEGRVVGQGTHEQLLRNCELYRQIAQSQLSASELEEVIAHG